MQQGRASALATYPFEIRNTRRPIHFPSQVLCVLSRNMGQANATRVTISMNYRSPIASSTM
jgi:hypothetical protein